MAEKQIELGNWKGKQKLQCPTGSHPMPWWNRVKPFILNTDETQFDNEEIRLNHCNIFHYHSSQWGMLGDPPKVREAAPLRATNTKLN